MSPWGREAVAFLEEHRALFFAYVESHGVIYYSVGNDPQRQKAAQVHRLAKDFLRLRDLDPMWRTVLAEAFFDHQRALRRQESLNMPDSLKPSK